MFLTVNKPRQKSRGFEETIAMLSSTGYKSGAGIYINDDSAMRQSTVYACVRVLSETIAQLPIEVQTRRKGQWVTAETHDVLGLLAEPNDWQTQHDLISNLVAWSEMQGNSYLFKVKNGNGEVREVYPLESNEVEAAMDSGRNIEYTVASSDLGINGVFGSDRIFHHRNFGIKGYMGLSTITAHREGIGLALQMENHASSSYAKGMQTNKWVKLDAPLAGEALDFFKKELANYQGGENAGKMPVLSDAEIKEFTGVSAVDAQYIESRKLQKEEIATIFLVPVFLLNSTENTTWGSGLEQISRSFARFSLNPRLNRLSQTLVRELVPENARHRTRIVFDTDQFTLGEFKDRMDGYRAAIESGVLNPNECRDIESRNPREGGEDYRIPVNIAIEGEENAAQDDQLSA